MQLYLDSFGAFLAVRNGMFAVRLRHAGEQVFAVRRVDAILLTRGTSLSADAALLAAEHAIPLLLIDAQTHFPLAQLSSGRPGSIATIRKQQAVFARAAAGLEWVAVQITAKIVRQRQVLQQQSDLHPRLASELLLADRVLAGMENALRQNQQLGAGNWDAATQAEIAGRLRGLEGTASRSYFQQMVKILDGAFAGLPFSGGPDPAFTGRQKRPAHDPFNTLLNYLYGMLYTSVHLALLKSGLDPYMGILHADRYGASPTLVFDAIEPYRPWADAVALQLVRDQKIPPDAFEQREDPTEGLWLSVAGKGPVIDAMLAFLAEAAPYEGRQVRRSVQIDLEAKKLAVLLQDFEPD